MGAKENCSKIVFFKGMIRKILNMLALEMNKKDEPPHPVSNSSQGQ
jgi:hypothetical protein